MPEKIIKTHMDGKYEIRSDLKISNESIKVFTKKCTRNRRIFNGIILASILGILSPAYGFVPMVVQEWLVLLGIVAIIIAILIRIMDNDPFKGTEYVSKPMYEMSVKLYSKPNRATPHHSFDTSTRFLFPIKHEWIGKLKVICAVKAIEKEMADLEVLRQAPELLDKVHERIIACVVVKERTHIPSNNRFSDIEIANAND
jgi:hypothetical protein